MCKDANDYSYNKESTDSLWCDLLTQICKISPLDNPNQPLIIRGYVTMYIMLLNSFD